MDWLTHPTRFLFFTGKGGVGKTSIACAAALDFANRGWRVLLVSTDPASNLDDVFGLRLGSAPTAVPGATGLDALNINPEASARAYRERVVGPYRGLLPDEAVRQMEEQFSGSCTVEIAAFDEFTGLLTSDRAAGRYHHVIFDTAPTGHTLRLLALPAAWTSFIGANPRGSSCLGPLSGLNAQQAQYRAALAALGDPARTTFVIVARPESSSLREADRSAGELAALGLANQRLVINGAFQHPLPGDEIAEAMAAQHRSALAAIPPGIARLPRSVFPLQHQRLIGIDALRIFLRDERLPPFPLPASADLGSVGEEAATLPPLEGLIDEIEAGGRGAVLTMGKGGVGKTTIAAAIALELARRGHEVHLTTTDPAAHVAEAVGGPVLNLTVDRIDPRAETEAYRARVLAASGKHLDAAARSLLEEDLRSPCTEEVAVFEAFARVMDDARHRFVVIDTAPTGHTLLLLDAAGWHSRELTRQAGRHSREGDPPPEASDASSDRGVTTPLLRLQDPSFTRVIIVTTPESTPVLESSRLQDDLRRAKIEPYAWVINGSLCATGTRDPLLRARAAGEGELIARVRDHLAPRTFLVPWRVVAAPAMAAVVRLP